MSLPDYPCESLSFSGLGASGPTPPAAAKALADALDTWAVAHAGRRIVHLTVIPVPAEPGAGLAALIVHTVGPEIAGELAEQVAAALEEVEPPDPTVPAQERSR